MLIKKPKKGKYVTFEGINGVGKTFVLSNFIKLFQSDRFFLVDENLSNRLKGKLLLQVEDRGRIWYVNPDDAQKFEVTFVNALPLFQKMALGITNANLNKIPLNTDKPATATGNKLKGKLLLQVEDKGRIWYVDFNGRKWEVTWANLMSFF